MTKYESYLAKYETFINDLEDILSDEDWRENLNDIAEDIFLAYLYRKDLEKAPKKLLPQIKALDLKLLRLGKKLKTLHFPAYKYFLKHFGWLVNPHHPSPATAVGSSTKS